MDCPSCRNRELALMESVMRKGRVLSVPDDVERLWCPACGFVSDRPAPKKGEADLAVNVPRGTARQTGKEAVKRAVGKAVKGPGRSK